MLFKKLALFMLIPLWLLLPFIITEGTGDKSIIQYIESVVLTFKV